MLMKYLAFVICYKIVIIKSVHVVHLMDSWKASQDYKPLTQFIIAILSVPFTWVIAGYWKSIYSHYSFCDGLGFNQVWSRLLSDNESITRLTNHHISLLISVCAPGLSVLLF